MENVFDTVIDLLNSLGVMGYFLALFPVMLGLVIFDGMFRRQESGDHDDDDL